MPKRIIASKPFPEATDMSARCSICNRGTPYLFKGIRYCAEHHPDPGEHIHADRRVA